MQVPGRHVLVVEGHSVRTGDGTTEITEVGVVTDDDVCGDLGGGGVGRTGQQPDGLAELDRRGLHHPGQLTVTDDGHDGHSGSVGTGVTCGFSHALNYSQGSARPEMSATLTSAGAAGRRR